MKRKAYFPDALKSQRAWLVNFKEKIAVYGHALGLTDEDITKKQTAAQAIIDAIDDADAALTASKVKNKAKNRFLNRFLAFRRRTNKTFLIHLLYFTIDLLLS